MQVTSEETQTRKLYPNRQVQDKLHTNGKAMVQQCMCLLLLQDKLLFGYDLERIIDDWILMGFLVGNDFIPHLPNMHISHVSGRYTCSYHVASSWENVPKNWFGCQMFCSP